MKIVKNILDLIGNTPMIELEGVLVKMELMNIGGSVKDRMVKYMILQAEERGELKKGMRIIEATSGNTGIALAMLSAARGYKFTAVMPASMSVERIKMMRNFGAEVVLSPAIEDMAGAIKKYEALIKKYPNAWLPRQFENQDNIVAHRKGLAQEIIHQAGKNIDAFVAGVGTGGVLIGVAKALKKINPKVKIIAVEPEESAVLSGDKARLHNIQGIGEGFIPKIIKNNLDLIDEVVTINSDQAMKESSRLANKFGFFVGISSGANFLVAKKLAKKYSQPIKIVTLFSDRGERYLSQKN